MQMCDVTLRYSTALSSMQMGDRTPLRLRSEVVMGFGCFIFLIARLYARVHCIIKNINLVKCVQRHCREILTTSYYSSAMGLRLGAQRITVQRRDFTSVILYLFDRFTFRFHVVEILEISLRQVARYRRNRKITTTLCGPSTTNCTFPIA